MPVEPIAIVATVLATTNAIHSWLKAKVRKQSITDDLVKVTQMLCDILQPLQEPQNAQKLNKNVLSVLLETAETLTSTKEHLALWQAKTTTMTSILGCLAPMTVIEFLENDREKLKERIMLLTLAIQVATMPGIDMGVKGTGDTMLTAASEGPLEEVRNQDVREFWKHNFGQVNCYFHLEMNIFLNESG